MNSLPTWAEEAIDLFASRVASKLTHQDTEISGRTCKKLLNLETRTFNRHAPNVAGAYKVGKIWFCSKSAWVAHHAAKTGAGSADEDAYTQAVRKAGAR